MKDMSDFVSRATQFTEIKAQMETEHYDKFISSPMVKLMLTMMPPAEPQELTETLLKAAFKAGMVAGEASCTQDLVQLLTKLKKEMGK